MLLVNILPQDSWKTIIALVAGKNATGTVWGDDFILVGRNGGWAGQDWNTADDAYVLELLASTKWW